MAAITFAACHSGGGTGGAGTGGGGGAAAAGGGTATGGAVSVGSGGMAGWGGTSGVDAGMAGDAADAAATDASLLARQDQACRQAIVVQCQRISTCHGLDSSGCAAYADRCPGYYFNPRSLRTVENVEACIPLLQQVTCTDLLAGLGPSCLAHGTGAAGDPCSASSECASGSCSGLAPGCGTCNPAAAIGEPCGANTGCGAGQKCDATSRVCVALPAAVMHAAAGARCDLAANPPVTCEGDLLCLPDGDHSTCTPIPGEGQPCARDTPQCGAGLQCDILPPGSPDTRLCHASPLCGSAPCPDGQYCFETSTVPLACRPYAKVGEACVTDSSSRAYQPCGVSAVCLGQTSVPDGDGGIVMQGTCAGYQELGAACGDTAPCRSPLVCRAGACAQYDPQSCFQAADAGPD